MTGIGEAEFHRGLGIPVTDGGGRARSDASSLREAGDVLYLALVAPDQVSESEVAEARRVIADGRGVADVGAAPMVSRFRSVGLSKHAARRAVEGLSSGTYFSFEDAAVSTATFDYASHLDETKLREVADAMPKGSSSTTESASSAAQHRSLVEIREVTGWTPKGSSS